MVLCALVRLCVLLQLLPVTVKSCDKILRSGRALTVLCGEESARNAEDARSTKCRPFIQHQPVEEVKGFSLEKPLCLARSFPPLLTLDERHVSADGFRFKRTSSVSAAEEHFPSTADSTTKRKDVLPITSGSTDLFFAAGGTLGGDVAGQDGEHKSEGAVTACKSSARVSILNPGGGTSSPGSALLFSAWKSVNCPGGLCWAQVRSF